jgi:transcriptional regulator with XRE-family HTH domain
MYRKEKFRGRQAELGLSVAEVADKAGVDPNTVSAIRNGKRVRTDTLEKVMNVLGLTYADISEQSHESEAAAAA